MAPSSSSDWRETLRRAYLPVFQRSPSLALALLVAQKHTPRTNAFVASVYEQQWACYQRWLDRSATRDDWLYLRGHDDVVDSVQIDGRLSHQAFDHVAFLTGIVACALRREFPSAASVTEYGCGIGRNLLSLERARPELDLHGYDLADAGVRVARAAAEKFGSRTTYAQLDYVHDGAERYVLPKTDVAMTLYSLVDAPYGVETAVRNMLDHVTTGLLLLEPAPENYPLSYRGVLGRVYSRTRSYARGFDAMIRALPVRAVRTHVLATSNNPLMYPTLYVIQK